MYGLVESSEMQNVMGIMSGVVLCCTWVVKNPKNDCVMLSCDDFVHCVLLSVCGFRLPSGVKSLGKRDLYPT